MGEKLAFARADEGCETMFLHSWGGKYESHSGLIGVFSF